jgi:hypothetical protein
MLRLWSLFLQPLESVCLRLALEDLGRHTARRGLNGAPRRIFVSSTYKDLVHYRRAVLEQVVRRDLFFRGMEFFGAEPASPPPAEKIVSAVRESDVYLGIFGVRYGFVDPKSGLSMTELEFNEAESSRKPMLLYLMRDDADDARLRPDEFEPDKEPKRKALIERIRRKHIAYQFTGVDDLARQVYEDLGKL